MSNSKEKLDASALSGLVATFLLDQAGRDQAEWLKQNWSEISAFVPMGIDLSAMVDDCIKNALSKAVL